MRTLLYYLRHSGQEPISLRVLCKQYGFPYETVNWYLSEQDVARLIIREDPVQPGEILRVHSSPFVNECEIAGWTQGCSDDFVSANCLAREMCSLSHLIFRDTNSQSLRDNATATQRVYSIPNDTTLKEVMEKGGPIVDVDSIILNGIMLKWRNMNTNVRSDATLTSIYTKDDGRRNERTLINALVHFTPGARPLRRPGKPCQIVLEKGTIIPLKKLCLGSHEISNDCRQTETLENLNQLPRFIQIPFQIGGKQCHTTVDPRFNTSAHVVAPVYIHLTSDQGGLENKKYGGHRYQPYSQGSRLRDSSDGLVRKIGLVVINVSKHPTEDTVRTTYLLATFRNRSHWQFWESCPTWDTLQDYQPFSGIVLSPPPPPRGGGSSSASANIRQQNSRGSSADASTNRQQNEYGNSTAAAANSHPQEHNDAMIALLNELDNEMNVMNNQ